MKQSKREVSRDGFQPVNKISADALVQKIMLIKACRTARAVSADAGPVKQSWRRRCICHDGGFADLSLVAQVWLRKLWPMQRDPSTSSIPVFRKFWRGFLNSLMPPHCLVSGDRVEGPGLLSGRGWAQLNFIEAPFCPGCAVPFAIDHGSEARCALCLSNQHFYDQTRAALVYDDHSVPLVVSFKHGDHTDYAPLLARLMIRAGRDLITPDSVLMPVPLHPRRLQARRFNQSAMLSQAISREMGVITDVNSLVRLKNTRPQKDKSPEARKRNVSGAFGMRDGARDIAGQHIILVDDVVTTGSTLSACARVLYRAGADRVDALVLARVVKGGAQAI